MMSMLSKARKLSVVVSNPHILTCRSRYLFILSHMRSRSTVLSHVLGSHSEVVGYCELHRPYNTRFDLLKMRADLYEESQRDLTNKYLLDKILHDDIPIADDLLQAAEAKIIILLREPDASLKSILNMGYRTKVAWYQNPQKAAAYYCKRLETLGAYADKLAGQYFFLDADELVENTDAVLDQLSQWLGLRSPLAARYEQFSNTGKRHYGDSSENIHSGVIKKTAGHDTLVLPPAVLERATESYRVCRSRLLQQPLSRTAH